VNAPGKKYPSFAGVAYDQALGDALALVPALRERAPRAEEERVMLPETLADLHRIGALRVLQNPMNILYRSQQGMPVVRVVDFESAYEVARHGSGTFYNPPTTSGFSAPEVPAHAPDQRADIFSLGAVLYTMLAGYDWTWRGDLSGQIAADREIDPELAALLLKAAQPDREQRYRSVDDMGGAITAYLESIWPGRS